jgi:AraC family transcriptional regulator
MNKVSTIDAYSRRLMRVVQTLWQDPTRQYSTEQLAAVAHFSPCHFHRIYREMMGETVVAAQQRLRLHFASRDLAQIDLPLIRVAQRAGYQSSAAFVRSFAAAHGVTPGVYRRQRLSHLQSRINQELDMYKLEFRLITAPIHLAARRHIGPYLAIGEAFSLLQLAEAALPVLPDARGFGIYHDDPHTIAPAQLRSDACVEISEKGDLPADLQRTQIPAGRYAVIEHRGPYSELEPAYHWLFGVWLPASGEQALAVSTIESYLNNPSNTAPKDLRSEIWLALAD